MRLFDERTRTYMGPAEHTESSYEFYDRSALPTIERIRYRLETWFQNYPSAGQRELRNRFETRFLAGFTELLIHESLKRLYPEVEVDPQVGSEQLRTPDFRVTESDGQRVYVEATVVTEEPEAERGAERALAAFYDIVNKMNLPDYFVGIHEVEIPKGRTPSARRFKQWLTGWVSSVDYEEMALVAQHARSFGPLSREYSDGECRLRVSLIPVSPEKRGSSGHRPLGVYPGSSRWGDSSLAIAKKVTDKGRRYPDLDGPLVVVANVVSKWMAGQQDVLRALFGRDYEDKVVGTIPDTDRVWCGPGGATYTRISAVGFGTWYPWNLQSAELSLVLNPWGERTDGIGELLKLPHLLVREGALVRAGGMPFSVLLDIEAGWPGALFDA